MLRSSLSCAQVPRYERVARRDALRALDPTEHNMERLNAAARGSGLSYHALRLRGDLAVPALLRAIAVMAARHPLVRVRIAQCEDTDALLFARATTGVPLEVMEVDDLDDWPRLVEADMNAGPLASDRGPLFAFALLEPRRGEQRARRERVLVEIHHHGVGDGLSALWLCHELLEELASPRSWAARPDRQLTSPFVLDDGVAVDLAALTSRVARLSAESAPSARDELLHELEQLEERLLTVQDDEGRLARRLFDVHSLIGAVISTQRDRVALRPDEGAHTAHRDHLFRRIAITRSAASRSRVPAHRDRSEATFLSGSGLIGSGSLG